jgi:hypothetical protein
MTPARIPHRAVSQTLGSIPRWRQHQQSLPLHSTTFLQRLQKIFDCSAVVFGIAESERQGHWIDFPVQSRHCGGNFP